MFFNGIYTPVITPFNSNEEIDFDTYTKHVEYLKSSGVHGLMIGGTTGEYYVESHSERVELLKLARSVVGADMQIIFGTGSLNPRASIELAADAAKHGATALLIGTPPYSLPTQKELADTALTIDKAADLPVMLYNYPARMGINMENAFFDRIFSESDNFVGIKESSGDINRLHMLTAIYPKLELACGMDDQALEFFAWGAESWVCAGSNFLPVEHVALYEACVKSNDFARARRIMAAMMPLMQVLEQGGKFIQSVKYGVELNSGRASAVRSPLQGLSDADKDQIAAVISHLKAEISLILSASAV